MYDLNLNPTANTSLNNIPNPIETINSNTTFDQKLGVTRAKDPVAESMVKSLEGSMVDGTKSSNSLSA